LHKELNGKGPNVAMLTSNSVETATHPANKCSSLRQAKYQKEQQRKEAKRASDPDDLISSNGIVNELKYATLQNLKPEHLRNGFKSRNTGRRIGKRGGDYITFQYSDALMRRAEVQTNNSGPYNRSRSGIYLDPKFSNKDMFVLEVCVKDCISVGEPLYICGIFTFRRQTEETFKNILQMLIEVAPDLAGAALVNSDGCRMFGKEIDRAFPLAFHGVDRNHLEQNLISHLKYTMQLSEQGAFQKWKGAIHRLLRGTKESKGLYDHEDRAEAKKFVESKTVTWPRSLRQYLTKNKLEILLGVQTLQARRAAGLTKPDGTVDFAWSQCAESAHMVVNRWMQTGHNEQRSLGNLVLAMESYFKATITAMHNIRINDTCEKPLKAEYKHLAIDRVLYGRLPTAEKKPWFELQRDDLYDSSGVLKAYKNSKC